MKWIIIGAGAIGGVLGARLHLAGNQVALVARGEHLTRIQQHGLVMTDPSGRQTIAVQACESIAEAAPNPGDVVVLAVKSQATSEALGQLADIAAPGIAVLCAQNGVDNERQAARAFANVYGGCVTLLASYVKPGEVIAHSNPPVGTVQVGRYPGGVDDTAHRIADRLGAAGVLGEAVEDVMAFKTAKLRGNLANALEVICTPTGDRNVLVGLLNAEADGCFQAAGLAVPSAGTPVPMPMPVDPSVPRAGGSTLQSVLRGAASVETDYLNGEIVLLGRLNGIPTPANRLVQQFARDVALRRLPSQGMDPAELVALCAAG